nr:FAD-binding monooxygenase [Streptomyces tumemacerans]
MTDSPFHVLIIGGGTGGMALAHGLKRAGISFAVYEREETRSSGLHGYRVGINPDGSRALKYLLPPTLFDTFLATCARRRSTSASSRRTSPPASPWTSSRATTPSTTSGP